MPTLRPARAPRGRRLPATHVDAEAERGHGGGLAQGQQQQEQGGGQLHQVEQVVVRKEVGRQRSGALGVGEELVVILAFLKGREPGGRASLEGMVPRTRRGPGKAGGRGRGRGGGPRRVREDSDQRRKAAGNQQGHVFTRPVESQSRPPTGLVAPRKPLGGTRE